MLSGSKFLGYHAGMERRLRRLPDRFYFFGLLVVLAALPRGTAYSLARKLGQSLERKHPETRKAILENLRTPALQENARDLPSVVRNCFEHLVCEDLDAYFYPFWSKRNLGTYFDVSGLQYLDRALDQGKGAILLTGHVGPVCAGMVGLGILGYPIHHVARDYRSDKSIEPAFRDFARLKVGWMESKMGHPLIDAHRDDNPNLVAAVLKIKQALSNNQLVSMAVDVNPTWVNDAVPVSFLGRRCRLTSSLVRLAYDCQCPIIPYFNLRHPRLWFRHRLEVLPRLELSGVVEEDVQRCADRLQEVIESDPAQWFSWDSLAAFATDFSFDRRRTV